MAIQERLSDITPLTDKDCFLVVQRPQPGFNYPLHCHLEFELNYLEHAKGVLRQVGKSIEEIGERDLVLVAGGMRHTFINPNANEDKEMFQITIHFNHTLFDSLLHKRHFESIRLMFDNAAGGLVFSEEMARQIEGELKNLSNDEYPDSFHNLLRLIELLKILSLDRKAHRLNKGEICPGQQDFLPERIENTLRYLHNNHGKSITVANVTKLLGMSEASMNRFLKQWTGKTFIDHLNDIRIADAVCRLIETTDSISEIGYKCGFNNLSNFNRIFKKRKGCTPMEYRKRFSYQRFRL